MLTSWRLKHFKSVLMPTELRLAPLTIFAGANSSGKSTVIQSMLLTAQTLQSPVLNRPVVLNGHMARLGAFTDIVSNADEESEISIGFTLELPTEEPHAFRLGTSPRPLPRRFTSTMRPKIDCSYMFSVRGDDFRQKEILRLQPRLERSDVSVEALLQLESVSETVSVKRSQIPLVDRIRDLKLPEAGPLGADLNTLDFEVVKLLSHKPDRRHRNLASRRNAGASFNHFLPNRLTVTYDAVETEVRQVVESLTAPITGEWIELELDERRSPLNEGVRQIVISVVESLLLSEEVSDKVKGTIARRLTELRANFSVTQLHRLYRLLPIPARAFVAEKISEKKDELRHAVRAGRKSEFQLRYVPLPELLTAGMSAIRAFFSFSVKYLGPLRDEPKPVYPLVGTSGLNDVGFRGEHTAAVLDVNRNTQIEYVPTHCFSDTFIEPAKHVDSLQRAVLDWLEYVGVGTELKTVDMGKLGHELKVATADSAVLHDLTQVGVGVSQVLPILVLSLLAEAGSTLIFEQPELHLHPRVQTRLADFFVAMSHLGKQCIVETHSEYLINRLRFRAATSKGREISDAVVLYFVEKLSDQSTYREITINEYGVIQDWPLGFFDENDANAAATLKAGLAKRKRKQKGDG